MIAFQALSACLLIAAASLPPPAQRFRLYWDEGLQLESAGHAVALRVGGRLQADFGGFDVDETVNDALGPFDENAELRRARVFLSATLYEDLYLRIQGDAGFASGLKDLYVEYRGLPVWLRVGHFKEPMGLEGSTSSKYSTFMERGLTNAAISPRNLGIMASANHDTARIAWAAGLFREDDTDAGFGSPEEWAVTLRASSAPVYRDDGRRLLHLGLGYRWQGVEDTTRFRQRPEIILAPNVIDTGEIAADSQTVWVIEAATVAGPWSLQSELVSGRVRSAPHHDPHFWAFYVYGSYSLTGESRRYLLRTELFDRLVPAHPIAATGGRGAWEIALRYSEADLDDDDVLGGRLAEVTAGLNWYPTATTRWLLNAVHSRRSGYGAFWGCATRLQVAF